ncbi:FG-GAP-like repeat-containing protein [Streptomyces beijiangensis]|uniref:FG-GAP repeat protein n=1 Tax=Streptomyces beijiangensis TaxID=163361 RepID=A0A939F5H4_9ACTN|nr:FG-GAP-like repeat-containing protein [Streptomyces beijiangensis]MBO0512261.1 FG-GAP repeat protein [Streptomyces beijiangensis]
MRNINRRGLRLASALVAAGLVLSAAPAVAFADDDNGLLTLTDAQTDELTAHAQLNPYGDDEGQAYDPQDATVREDAATAPTADATTPNATADSGSWKVTKKSSIEGDYGMTATTAVGGTRGDYFALDALGIVQRHTADGKQVWRRDNASLYTDWKVTNTRPWQTEPYPARIIMGYNAVGPFTVASDNGYTTGDLTGDGVDDLVYTASVGSTPYRPFTSPGSTLPTGTFVTVLDGATGKTLWSKLYTGVYNIKLVGKTLVVADSPYLNLNAPKGSKTTLTGVRFSYADGALTSTDAWSYDAGALLGASWASLEPLGNGLVAASWDQRKLSATAAPSGTTLVFDTTDGSVKWKATNRLYSRQLHYDAARKSIVALEQSDPNEGVVYELASYALADGTRTTVDRRVNALPIDLVIGDVQGSSKPEYTVSESTVDNNLYINSNTVRALNGDDGSELWSRTIKRDPANSHNGGTAWGLEVVDHKVVASYKDDASYEQAANRGGSRYGRLAVLSGRDGEVRWEQRGLVTSQMWAQPYKKNNGWHLRTVDTNENIRTYNLGSGKQENLVPLRSAVFASVSTDINGDKKKDLIVGGTSNGVFAYDGPSMVSGTPKQLWAATVPGQVHALVKADVNGDHRDETIVAADSAAAVLDSRTGKVLTTIDGGGQFVRSVQAADVNGDGKAEIVVATDKVRVYSGTGKKLWEYAAPASAGDVVFADVSFGDGHLYAQYAQHPGDAAGSMTPGVAGGVALNSRTGKVDWSFTPQPGAGTDGSVWGAPLPAGTFASSGIPYADGHAVAFTVFSIDSQYGSLTTVVQIRDGRTGELLHEGKDGGPWGLGNWLTGPDGLTLISRVSMRTFGPNGQDSRVYTVADSHTAAFATGPGGRRIIVSGQIGGASTYDPSILTAGDDYPSSVADLPAMGGDGIFVGDLNGDGVDEIVSLNADEYGADRTAALEGGGISSPFTAMRNTITATIDPS